MVRSFITRLFNLCPRAGRTSRPQSCHRRRRQLLAEALENRQLLSGFSFSPPSHGAVGQFEVAVGDLNGDGVPDLVTTSNSPAPNYTSWLVVYLGNGNGTFREPLQFDSGVRCYGIGIEVADLNRDGRQDVVMTHGGTTPQCFGDKVTVHLGNGTGALESPGRVYVVGGSLGHLAIADFNRDGNPDLALPASDQRSIYIYIGAGNGTFSPGPIIPASGNVGGVSDIHAQDLNGDGLLDLAFAMESSNALKTFHGSGTGNFSPAANLSVPSAMGAVSGDFNEDGIVDLAVISRFGGFVSVFRGTGGGSFAGRTDIPGTANLGSITVGDYDVDGHLDLAVGSTSETRMLVLAGDGLGNFRPAVGFDTGRPSAAYRVRSADLNNDSLPDLVSASAVGHTVLRNTSFVGFGTSLAATANRRFAAVVSSFTDAGPNSGTAFDYFAFTIWGDNTNFSTGGISELGNGRFDVAASHTYAAPGQYTAVTIIYDLRDISRFTYALTTVTVTAPFTPPGGPGGRHLGDVIAALESEQPHDRWDWHADAVEPLLDTVSTGRPR